MNEVELSIVNQLKQELERVDPEDKYSQWVMAVAIRKGEGCTSSSGTIRASYTARTIVMVNETPLVDGMDIQFTETDAGVLIDPEYYENSPDFQGGTVESSLMWASRVGYLCYLQLVDPFGIDGDACVQQ